MSDISQGGMGGAAQGFQNLNNTQQQGVKNLGLLIQAIKSVFPQQTGVALTATAGTATLPAAPLGFIVVSLPSGASVKVPYYGG